MRSAWSRKTSGREAYRPGRCSRTTALSKAATVRLANPGDKKRKGGQGENATVRILAVSAEAERLSQVAGDFLMETGLSPSYHDEAAPSLMQEAAPHIH